MTESSGSRPTRGTTGEIVLRSEGQPRQASLQAPDPVPARRKQKHVSPFDDRKACPAEERRQPSEREHARVVSEGATPHDEPGQGVERVVLERDHEPARARDSRQLRYEAGSLGGLDYLHDADGEGEIE